MTENPDPTPEDLRAILAPEDLAWSDASAIMRVQYVHENAYTIKENRDLRRELAYMRKLVAALEREKKALRLSLQDHLR